MILKKHSESVLIDLIPLDVAINPQRGAFLELRAALSTSCSYQTTSMPII